MSNEAEVNILNSRLQSQEIQIQILSMSQDLNNEINKNNIKMIDNLAKSFMFLSVTFMLFVIFMTYKTWGI